MFCVNQSVRRPQTTAQEEGENLFQEDSNGSQPLFHKDRDWDDGMEATIHPLHADFSRLLQSVGAAGAKCSPTHPSPGLTGPAPAPTWQPSLPGKLRP